MSDRGFTAILRVTALIVLAALFLFLLAVLPASAAAPQDVLQGKVANPSAAKPPQAILCDCSCWVCLCTQHVTCGEKGCRHPRPTPPAPKTSPACDRCRKPACSCGCKGPLDCNCPKPEPRHGDIQAATDGGPAWTYNAKTETWWRKVPAMPTPANQAQPVFQPAPLHPMFFRPSMPMGPPMGFGGGMRFGGRCGGGG